MADPTLKADCPSCGCPDQHCYIECGFCGALVPLPAGAVAADGSARVEEVYGYRGWRVVKAEDGTPRLSSPLFPMEWVPGEWMVAECRSHGHKDPLDPEYHGSLAADKAQWSPVKGCGGGGHGCGFYAGRTREHLIDLGYGRYTEDNPSVIGKVQMQGKAIPATNGWRAQKVRPVEIYVPYEFWELARDLKAVYGPHGVVVDVASTLLIPLDSDLRWCRKCGSKLNRSTTCKLCGNVHL